MRNESQQRVEPVFNAACERPAGPERAAYLDGACGDDLDLRSRVDALLAAHEEASEFLDAPAVSSSREGPGSSIGVYKLLQEIGEGGMGVVYMAEQESPVRRKVALKVIKLGMDTKQVIARFEAERQALALMDHANIARVFDAGSTDAGRPFFVMELVKGVPIHEYCDTHGLTTEERLVLFVEVCRAVQHAHQKGIIHRDLKPSNVMVTSHDGKPVTKIIDFGVAKATNQRLTERTLFTEFHQVIGTPEYMSPEQAEMSGLDVDTRSDIYSLGVLLYQLLTGTTPVDPTELRTVAYSEMTRMIREDEAPVPSTRISKLGEDGAKIAKQRGSDLRGLSRDLRGDLDWIVMKALEKDRTRRYDSASAFAEDVGRHLEDRPVDAGPPGAAYRVRKFVQRNNKAVLASTILLVVVGLGLAGTSLGFVRAREEADRSHAVSATLQEVLTMTHFEGGGQVAGVRGKARELFGADHATYATVLDTLAQRMHDAGEFETAAELCRESLDVWRRDGGEDHPSVGFALARLGQILRAQGEVQEAEGTLREALVILDAGSYAGSRAACDARVELSDLVGNRGDLTEADALLGESLAYLRASPKPAHAQILVLLEKRYSLQLNQSSVDAGETIREVYEEANEFYPDGSPMLGFCAFGYGRHLAQHGDVEAAEPYLREAIERFRALSNPPTTYMFGACDSLFQIIRRRPDAASIAETDELLSELIEAGAQFLGVDELVKNRRYYASRMVERERYGDALDSLLTARREMLAAGRTSKDRENLRDNMVKLAFLTANQVGLPAEVHERALKSAELAVAAEPEHPAMLVTLAAVQYRMGDLQSALQTFAGVPPLTEVRGGLSRVIAPGDHAYRAMLHERLGDHDKALAELELLRAAHERRDDGLNALLLLREAEALIDPPSSAETDD